MSYRTKAVTLWFGRHIMLRKLALQGIGTVATEHIRVPETVVSIAGGSVFTPEACVSGNVPFARSQQASTTERNAGTIFLSRHRYRFTTNRHYSS